jgi:hypothetical protein
MSFKINDKVIFKWNFTEYPCEIIEILEYVNIYNCNRYLVKFPPNSYAGSVTNPRIIIGSILKLDSNYINNNQNQIINTQRFDIEI